MIASVFSKTRPFNYLAIGILLFAFFIIKTLITAETDASWLYFAQEFGLFVVVFASSFLINFIALKNELTKNNKVVTATGLTRIQYKCKTCNHYHSKTEK